MFDIFLIVFMLVFFFLMPVAIIVKICESWGKA